MNAAFLLVTTAVMVGQGGDKDKKPVPPPATPIVASSSCGDACCDSYGRRLCDRLRGLFNRDRCNTSCQPSCVNQCDNHCRSKLFNFEPRCREPRCHHHHAPAPSCCNDACGREGIFARLRHSFHRNDTCCDGGCGNGTVAPPVKTEKIDNPKKMPDPKKDDKKPATEVRIDVPPSPLAPPTTPTVEVVPVPVPSVPAPRVEGERRDPF